MKRLILMFVISIVLFSCQGGSQKLLGGLKETEADVSEDGEISESRINELKAEIKKQKDLVETKVKADMELGIHYRMLAVEYLSFDMFGPALDNLEEAIYIEPVNHILHCLAGVCSAQLAKASADPVVRNNYYLDAEFYYMHALEIKPEYDDALYGIGVLYAYELERYISAQEYLEKLVEIRIKRDDARFALAYVYVNLDQVDKAEMLYDEIISRTSDADNRKKAEALKKELLEGIYGSE